MKKLLLFILPLTFCFNTLKAQEFSEGDNYLQVGYGFGLGYGRLLNAYQVYDGYKFSGFGPVGLSFERAVTNHIGIGASLSYSTYGATWIQNDYLGQPYDYSYRWNTLAIMARGAYHFSVSNDKIDPYIGIGLGFLKYGYKWTSSDPAFNETNNSIALGTPLGYQFLGGIRFMFSDNVGGFAEVGYGLAVGNIGLTMKF